ncbi:hypothetical protein C8J56DRAFT_834206 [Mycena floridula]|nr:hypothetical protein C8J56DRAFT_834206 [Mycena floridula]
MPTFHCTICYENRLMKELRVFVRCGHGCCTTCLPEFRKMKPPKCHMCKIPINWRQDALELFLEIVNSEPIDPKAVAINTLADGLKRMDSDCEVISVERAASKIEKASKDMEYNNLLATTLLEAVEDFRTRIIPQILKIQSQAEEITRLKDELSRAKGNANKEKDKTKEIAHERDRLRKRCRELQETEAERDQAMALADKAAAETLKLREINANLDDENTKTAQKVKNLENQLEGHIRTNKKRKAKIQELEEDKAGLEAQVRQLQGDMSHLQSESSMMAESSYIEDSYTQSGYMSDDLEVGPPSSTSRSSLRIMSVNTAPQHHRAFDGLPGKGFGSWQLGVKANQSKRKASDAFPIKIDRSGKPLGNVQFGPKRSRRVAPQG